MHACMEHMSLLTAAHANNVRICHAYIHTCILLALPGVNTVVVIDVLEAKVHHLCRVVVRQRCVCEPVMTLV
jgi:hypothetical protein